MYPPDFKGETPFAPISGFTPDTSVFTHSAPARQRYILAEGVKQKRHHYTKLTEMYKKRGLSVLQQAVP